MKLRIPLAKPEVTESDRRAVLDVLGSNELSFGPVAREFEDAICRYVGVPYAVAVNSGTSALHLAVKTLALTPGAEVILPSFTFAAPLNVILQEKLSPVFVDIDTSTLNMAPAAVEAAITARTEAIVAVHTFGRPAAADQLRKIADDRGIVLIEDACEALGAELRETKAGCFGDVATFAFYPNKQITTGEGGMFVTRDRDLAERARRLRNQGRDPSLDWYQQREIGYSYRLSDINCALGVEQLRRIEAIVERRQALAELYERHLSGVEEVVTPPARVRNGRISWFCYVIQLKEEFTGSDRDWLCRDLLSRGIGTGRYFAPLHRQPVLNDRPLAPELPATEKVAARVVSLPFFNQMSAAEVEEVCDALKAALRALGCRSGFGDNI